MGSIVTQMRDMRHVAWSESYNTSGTSGTFLKASEGAGTGRLYYKLSCYDYYRGVFGHECVNELVASRLMSLLGVPHVSYRLIHALVTVDGREFETWLSASGSFKHSTERKQAFDLFWRFNRQDDESPLALADRLGWGTQVRQMMLVDYLIANRDRHGANIEVLRGEDGVQRLAPLFDNGLSFLFSCYGDEQKIAEFDVMQDLPVNNFVGMRSLEKNLDLLKGTDLRINPLEPTWKAPLFEGLDEVISSTHRDVMWDMINRRWSHYEALRNR